VRLPREEREELEPPTTSHVAAVNRTVPSVHRLPLLFLDWSGARVKAIDTLLVGDYDERGGRVRLIEFVRTGNQWAPGREWAYDLDPTPRQAGYGEPCLDGENGLAELYAIDATRLITLERACLVGAPDAPAFNPVRLHLVDLAGADDVSSHPALAGVDVRPAPKRLLLDLTTLTPRLPPALRTGSNFEGVSQGPPAPDGSPTLLLVSDDNFRATQTLAFVWLKLQR